MALIKCFTESHIENMAACLQLRPDKMILIGSKNLMGRHVKRYREFLCKRNQRTEIVLCDIQKHDLGDLYTAVKGILCREENCIIDLTGGEELVIMAVGAVVAGLEPDRQAGIQVVRFDFSRNCLLDCIHDHRPIPGKSVSLTVEELIALQGGIVYPSSYQPAKEVGCKVVDPLWDIVASAPREWNRTLSMLSEFESRADSKTQVFLPLAFLRGSIPDFEEKEEQVRDLLGKFHQCGVIEDRSSRNVLEYTYTSSLLRYCTQREGNILEIKTLLEARALLDNGAPYYQDCLMGVHIDWDGILHEQIKNHPETRNEIDVIVVRGMTPLFISCKNGTVKEEELYKLHTVATQFGGPHAKKMLIATDLEQKSATATRAFIQRAWDMDIFLVTDAAELSKAEWRQTFQNAMA